MSPSHSFLQAHHRELVAPPSRVMSIRLSPTAYRLVCGTGSCWCWPSSRGDVVVEGKGVPGEPSSRSERSGDPVKGTAAVGPGRQMQQRPERAVDQCRWLV